MKVLGKMQKWVRNGVILKVGIFHVFGFFSFMEPSRKTKLVSYYKLMVGYLHVEAVGPTRGQRILMGLQSRFLKRPENGHFSAASQRNLKISRPANSLAIPLHWPFLPKSCLTTLKSARSQNAFFSETPIWPLFGHFGPP